MPAREATAVAAVPLARIEEATGRPWRDWLAEFERMGAATMSHKSIADALAARGDLSHWWCQQLTIAYEQETGRRLPGQRADGTFTASASRTMTGAPAALRQALAALVCRNLPEGVTLEEKPKETDTPKRLYWRAGLSDGTRLTLAIEPKPDSRIQVGITHAMIPLPAALPRLKAHWKAVLTDLPQG